MTIVAQGIPFTGTTKSILGEALIGRVYPMRAEFNDETAGGGALIPSDLVKKAGIQEDTVVTGTYRVESIGMGKKNIVETINVAPTPQP